MSAAAEEEKASKEAALEACAERHRAWVSGSQPAGEGGEGGGEW